MVPPFCRPTALGPDGSSSSSSSSDISQIRKLAIKLQELPLEEIKIARGRQSTKDLLAEGGYKKIDNPITFMIPFLPRGLKSLTLIQEGNDGVDLCGGAAEVLSHPSLSSLQHLKLVCHGKTISQMVEVLWAPIESGTCRNFISSPV